MSAEPTLATVTALPSAMANRPGSLGRPFSRPEAFADLASLGRLLDHQVTRPGSATVSELDATLTVMRAVHDRVVAELSATLTVRPRGRFAYWQKLRRAA
ncbi:hypothetical protein [Kitasatospora sp. NBC_01266]|uniref:hypothetical protein n=1 Tax=Kitasatospora sp. NBC_01266 TaxID=2903572 RepID=UPI002E2F41B5|nr:hypothetical protein [Kitasatospora sp. NBC_01266]